MIILSIGMPRAGSGWYYNLTQELALAAGFQDAHQIRQSYHLQRVLTEVNCNIGAFTPLRLGALLIPSLFGNTFVVKAHAAPTPFALRLIRIGMLRPTYIYRDPRDAMLSAFENGQRANQKGRPNAFSHLVDFDASLVFMKEYIHISEAWLACPDALHTRFESLLMDYENEAFRLARFLGLNDADPRIQTVIQKFQPGEAQSGQKGLHFSKGKTGRYRQKMTSEQQAILAREFGPYLERMGYPLE